MVDTLIDLKALLVERVDCDAGTVQKLREALTQGDNQYHTLRDVSQLLKTKAESGSSAAAKRWHLKLGIAAFFLGHLRDAIADLRQAEGPLACFYLGRALEGRQDFDEALKAFEKAELSGYTPTQVQLMRAGVHRQKGELKEARQILGKLQNLASHSAEYHFQLACCFVAEGDRSTAIDHLERAVELDPSHSGALFQLGYANDLAGNDEEAIGYYERCLNCPPVHVGVLMNLGVLYEDNEKFDKAADCYRKVLHAHPSDEHARLFLKDAEAATKMYYSAEEDQALSRFIQVLEVPVTEFELSVRNRNCLQKMNIRTLGDLTRVSDHQLMNITNFGETSLTELKEMMASKGLRIGQSLEGGGYPGDRPQPSFSAADQAILNKPVCDLQLSVRSRKCMNRLGLQTLGDLVQRSADELLELKNFGMTSLGEIRNKPAENGLRLRGD